MRKLLAGLVPVLALLAAAPVNAACPVATGVNTPFSTATLLATQTADQANITGGCGRFDGVSASNLQNANILQNGDFQVDQRNEGAAVIPPGGGTPVMGPDRWQIVWANPNSGAGNPTVQRTAASAGFVLPNELAITNSSTQATSTPASLFEGIQEIVEGADIADLQWGTASALPVSYSFSFKASVAGTYSFALQNGTQARSYLIACTAVAATVTPCSGTIPGDTAGSWSNGVGTIGIIAVLTADCGSTYQNSTPNAWVSGNLPCSASQAHPTLTASSTFEISPVKLERGGVVSPTQPSEISAAGLAKLQRFYRKTFPAGTAPGQNKGLANARCAMVTQSKGTTGLQFSFDPPMFGAPTVTTYSPVNPYSAVTNGNWYDINQSVGIPANVISTTGAATNYGATSVLNAASVDIASVSNPTVAAGDTLCIHATFDTGK